MRLLVLVDRARNSTDPAELDHLSTINHYDTLYHVCSNPSTSIKTLEKIAHFDNTDMLKYLDVLIPTDIETLRMLTKMIFKRILNNPNATEELQLMIRSRLLVS